MEYGKELLSPKEAWRIVTSFNQSHNWVAMSPLHDGTKLFEYVNIKKSTIKNPTNFRYLKELNKKQYFSVPKRHWGEKKETIKNPNYTVNFKTSLQTNHPPSTKYTLRPSLTRDTLQPIHPPSHNTLYCPPTLIFTRPSKPTQHPLDTILFPLGIDGAMTWFRYTLAVRELQM